MAGESNDDLAGGERGHLAQKGHLIRNVVEDAHGDADVERVLEFELEEIGLDELAPVGNSVLLGLLPGERQHVAGEVDADNTPRATPREVDRVHPGPAPDIENLLTPHVPRFLERDGIALENRLSERRINPAPKGRTLQTVDGVKTPRVSLEALSHHTSIGVTHGRPCSL